MKQILEEKLKKQEILNEEMSCTLELNLTNLTINVGLHDFCRKPVFYNHKFIILFFNIF